MPANPRVRNNNVQGTTTDAPLTNVATTINSAGLANLEAIATEHAVIILDPFRVAGAPEIVIVTAHTGAATSATITRGAYGTSARQHALGTLWVHAALTEDFIAIVTSGTRPSDPYRGQFIFETDTDKLVGRSVSDAWQTALDLGDWDTWVPTITNITQGNGTISAKWTRVGRTVFYRFSFTFGSAGSAMGTGPRFTLPVQPAAQYVASVSQGATIGTARMLDTGTADYAGQGFRYDTTAVAIVVGVASGTHLSFAALTSSVPMTWAVGDTVTVDGCYEALA